MQGRRTKILFLGAKQYFGIQSWVSKNESSRYETGPCGVAKMTSCFEAERVKTAKVTGSIRTVMAKTAGGINDVGSIQNSTNDVRCEGTRASLDQVIGDMSLTS